MYRVRYNKWIREYTWLRNVLKINSINEGYIWLIQL